MDLIIDAKILGSLISYIAKRIQWRQEEFNYLLEENADNNESTLYINRKDGRNLDGGDIKITISKKRDWFCVCERVLGDANQVKSDYELIFSTNWASVLDQLDSEEEFSPFKQKMFYIQRESEDVPF